MPLPEIFTLISCPMIGQLGPETTIVENDPCQAGGQKYKPVIEFLDYEFDTWERAELIKVSDAYAMTRRLFDAARAAGLKGFSARPMKATRGDDMDESIVLPEFVRLWVDGEADGPSGWWDRG